MRRIKNFLLIYLLTGLTVLAIFRIFTLLVSFLLQFYFSLIFNPVAVASTKTGK